MSRFEGGDSADGRDYYILLDPDHVDVVRVEGHEFEDGEDRIVTAFDTDDVQVRVAVHPDAFMSFTVAILNALGFPEGDLEYLADRYMKEVS